MKRYFRKSATALLAVADDVDARFVLLEEREMHGVVLRFLQRLA